jgi:surface carbohydrate biosynthesis protein
MSATSTRRILIVVPNVLRDLEGHSLLGYQLATKHGLDVVYSDGRELENDLLRLAPDGVVLDQLAWDYRARQARMVKELGMQLALLPTSGLFQEQDSQAHEQIAGKYTGANELVDRYFVWGDAVRELLVGAGILPNEIVHVVGSPRFDFYAEPYLALAGTRSDFVRRVGMKNADAPIIVWAPNNTSIVSDDPSDIERWAAATNVTVDGIKAEMADVRTQYEEHSRVVLELARRHPDWNFLVKVHPSDRREGYNAMAGERENIYVVHDIPILNVLRHGDVLLQRYSTTANESAMLGKPVVLLDIGEYRIELTEDFVRGNDVARSIDETESVIERYLEGGAIPEEQRRVREEFIGAVFHRIDGLSCERCAAVLSEMVSGAVYTDERQREVKVRVAAALRRQRLERVSSYADPRTGIRAARAAAWRLRRLWSMRGEASAAPRAQLTPALIQQCYSRYDALRLQAREAGGAPAELHYSGAASR